MGVIPDQLRDEVIAELYRRFDDMKWKERTQPERSAAYQRLVEDPIAGGGLAPHLPFNKTRLMMKNGPAKKYRRALEGFGPHTGFTKRRTARRGGVVEAVLNRDWAVADGPVTEKPVRCLAERGDSSHLVARGSRSSPKELIWYVAAHVAAHCDGKVPWIVATKRGNAPIDETLSRHAKRLSKVIG